MQVFILLLPELLLHARLSFVLRAAALEVRQGHHRRFSLFCDLFHLKEEPFLTHQQIR